MSGFTIRLADFPRDRAAALAFIDGLQAFEFEVEPNRRLDATVAAEHMEVLDKRLAEHGGAIFIAQDVAGTALGWSVVHETSDDIYVIAPERRTAYIAELFVVEAWRGKGVGRALIGSCEDWARALGIGIVLIGVLPGNARAHATYTRAGYGAYSLQLRKKL